MNDSEIRRQPATVADILVDTEPQPNWPDGHAPKVPALVDNLERREEFMTLRLAWASGLMLVVRRAG